MTIAYHERKGDFTMKRPGLISTSLTGCALLLTSVATATAQQRDGSDTQNRQPRFSQQQDRDDRQRDRAESQRDRGDRQESQRRGQSRMSDQERQEALAHFLAGYYSGYSDGYYDGADDIVIGIVGQQRARAQQRDASGQDPRRMQEGRRAARTEARRRMRSGQQGQSSMVSLEGEIINMKTVPLRNTDIEHRIVRIETEDGNRRIVDLGPTDQTDDLDIREGDQIEVRGTPVMAGDVRILAARKVTSGDDTVNVKYQKLNFRDRDPQVNTRQRDRQNRNPQNRNERN